MATDMALTEMTPAQMLVLKSFAGVTSGDELSALMRVLKQFYAKGSTVNWNSFGTTAR